MICALITFHTLTGAAPANAAEDPRGPAVEGVDFATFEVSRLRCVIGNNKTQGEHLAGYNGIFSMTAPDEPETPFVPTYAGVNLEHYFDTRPRHPDSSIYFEPRFSPMTFTRISDTAAELHQPPTPLHHVESWTLFELREPYYVDVTFRCIPRASVFEGGFMGIFWASYINAPLNKSIYFLDAGSTLEKPKWRQFCTQYHNHCSTVRQESDTMDILFQEDPPVLFNQLSSLRFSEPFFYGCFRDMVLIYIFEPNPYLRFAHSPAGGGPTADGTDTNPAWDFQLVVPNYEVGKEYGFKMRLVYKSWGGRADVLEEVRIFRAAR